MSQVGHLSQNAATASSLTCAHLKNRAVVRVQGLESADLLQGLMTNDIVSRFQPLDEEGLLKDEPVQSIYTHMLNTQGRVLFDVIVFKGFQEHEFLLDVDFDGRDKLVKHLKMYKVRRKIDIQLDDHLKVLAFFQKNAPENITELTAAVKSDLPGSIHCDRGWISPNDQVPALEFSEDCLSSVDPRLPELGHRIIAPQELEFADQADHRQDYQQLRYWFGVAEGAQEVIPGKALPLEYNVDYLHGISFHKGCYIGQELTARTHHTGVIRKRIMPVVNLDQEFKRNGDDEDVDFLNEADKKIGQNHDEFTAKAEAKKELHIKSEKRKADDEELKDKILLASLKHVPQHSWSRQAVAEGVQDLGYPPVSSGIIDNHPLELILFHMRLSNEQLEQKMAADVAAIEAQGERLRIRKFLRSHVENRLRMNIPFMGHWTEALAISSLPQNLCETVPLDLELFDLMWHYAGDKATDLNWYTKRISLGAIYKGTEMAMLQDKSEDFQHTWEFLDRRFQDEMDFSNLVKNSNDVQNVVKGVATTLQNIFGLQSKH
ncbi:hypothetical protein TCAL_00240 [Tigriopus californicus]|uniref:Ubiquinone biosynthesis protein n=1 Tax=Tigriopus californicus TaxID=6832 RepID=A0A553P1C3_TIGCA|nr:hypothetical protein TCAL_00240 [Tigriopus californicus]